jgi:hypothetical protein
VVRGVKEWRPDRLAWILEDLERHTADTAKGDLEFNDHRLMMLADVQEDGTLFAWHVTDDPELVKGILRARGDLAGRHPLYPSICRGLYVSLAPDYWARAVSRRQWDFLQTLTPEDKKRLVEAVFADLAHKGARNYITRPEHEAAMSAVDLFASQGNVGALLLVTDQPFNVNVPRIAKEIGVADPFRPQQVEVVFVGRYIDWASGFRLIRELASLVHDVPEDRVTNEQMCDALRRHGWDGSFTKASMGAEQELVIWNAAEILRFGDWFQEGLPRPAMGDAAEPAWMPGMRFEAEISADRKLFEIVDREHGVRFASLDRGAVREIARLVDTALRAMDAPARGRLEEARGRFVLSVSPDRSRADIRDLEAARRGRETFISMSRADLEELGIMLRMLAEWGPA